MLVQHDRDGITTRVFSGRHTLREELRPVRIGVLSHAEVHRLVEWLEGSSLLECECQHEDADTCGELTGGALEAQHECGCSCHGVAR